MPLRCFIACAVNRKDVDAIYDNAIAVVLKKANITPIRVDRIEHNDDIDNRIIQELERCHFCIADLTYARPSVYFEAGYAIGSEKTVIFTCRSDHFRAKAEDVFGNLRVHFDLQMKNIIPWRESSQTFKKKLARRVELVTRPLLLMANRQEQTRAIQAEFMSMPDQTKFEKMVARTSKIVRRRGFKVEFIMQSLGQLQATRCDKSQVRIVILELYPSLTKRELGRFHGLFSQPRIHQLLENLVGEKGKAKLAHVFLGSLRPIPLRRVAEALPYFSSDLALERFTNVSTDFDDTKQVTDLHILDDISSVDDFVSMFGARLELACESDIKELIRNHKKQLA